MESAELPIVVDDIECVTECWTYNRLAILKTMPYYQDWIASHYELYATNTYNFLFGKYSIYTPDYHDIVLERKPIYIMGLKKGDVESVIKQSINMGNYIIIYAKPFSDRDFFHEILIYGYDDHRKAYKTVGLEKRSFQKKEYTYQYIEDTLEDVQNDILNHQKGIGLAINYQYALCTLRPRKEYNIDNCVYEAYRKIKNELYGERQLRYLVNEYGDYREEEDYYYTGICCLDALENMLRKLEQGMDLKSFRGVTNAAKKMYEHRRMIAVSMKYICEHWKMAITDTAWECIDIYEESVKTVQKWVYMIVKYGVTGDVEMINNVIQEIPKEYEKEKSCLNIFIQDGINMYKVNLKYV